MRLGPARPALASPALAGLCRVHAAFSYRDSPAGVPPAGRPLLRCWSLLALTGMLEGVREWGRALSVYSLFSVLGVALSQIRPCNTTPSGQVRMPNLHREQHLQPAWIGATGQSAVVIVWGLLTHDSHQPGHSLQLHQAHLTRYLASLQAHNEGVLLISSALLFALTCSPPRAKETLCRLGKTASRHSSAAGKQGKQGTPFAGYAM
jgi:hypothetical protein